jgi:EAL domain-containing protein (putative c-di-GMP-specific phosphodiesterase class I)
MKINRTFVCDVPTGLNDSAIVSSVIALGCAVNLGIIAEGIETKDQLNFLLERQCQKGQGFFFGRTMPVKLRELSENSCPARRWQLRLGRFSDLDSRPANKHPLPQTHPNRTRFTQTSLIHLQSLMTIRQIISD